MLVVAVAGCGASAGTTAPPGLHGDIPVRVTATFPAHQRLAQRTRLTVTVTNVSDTTLPNVAVTLTNPRYGTAAQAFGTLIAPTRHGQPIVADRSRPIWIINRAPGPCDYSCANLGPGAGATAYANTWALGALRPGRRISFSWQLTAVQAGAHAVRYQIAPELTGAARATDAGGGPAAGTLKVQIAGGPRRAWVRPDGQVVHSG